MRLGDCLPPNHLARFVVDSVAQRDLEVASANFHTFDTGEVTSFTEQDSNHRE